MRTFSLALGLLVVLVAAPVLAQNSESSGGRGGEPAVRPAKNGSDMQARPVKAPDTNPGDPTTKHVRRTGGIAERNPAMWRDVTDDDVNDILAFTREYLPAMNADLVKIREADPAHFRQVCRRLRFEIRQLRALKADNPEAFGKAIEEKQLQVRARDLAATIRQTTDSAEQGRLRQELRSVLQRLLDAELVTRTAQIHRLEQALQRVRDEMRERQTNRDAFISKQLEDIIKAPPDQDVFEPSFGPRPEPKREGKPDAKGEPKHNAKPDAKGDAKRAPGGF
jgi:hypothetical protein